MSTKVHHDIAIAGMKDLNTLLDIIQNKDKYTKAMKDLEAATAKANETIKLAGGATKLKNLESELASKESYLNANSTALSEAKRTFKADKANQIKEMKTKLSDMETEKQKVWDIRNVSLLNGEKALASANKELSRRESIIDDKEQRLENQFKLADNLKEEYEAKVAKIKAAGL